MVKLDDKALAKEVGVFALPSIVFFRVNSEPTIYAGDLKNEEAILEWLLVQKDPSNEAIEEQSGENLLKTIDNTEAVAVFICKLQVFISVTPYFLYYQDSMLATLRYISISVMDEMGVDVCPKINFRKKKNYTYL